MKAAHKVGSGPLTKSLRVDTNVPLPKNADPLPANSVLVRVAYTSLNPVDSKIADLPLLGGLVFPGIPCFDYAGTVIKSRDTNFKDGQRVFGMTDIPKFGACAEYVVAPAKSCVALPDNVKLEDAATLGIAGITAYQTIVPFVTKGSKVLINGGSGGTGTFGIQIAKAVGCYVTTTCSGPNVQLCKDLGADEVIDYRTQNVVDTLKRSGKQYDLIVDNVFGDVGLYWSCHAYLKPGAKFLTIAGGPSLWFIKDFLSVMLWPSMLGGGKRSFKFLGAAANLQDYEKIAAWVGEGVVKPVIEKTYDIEDIREAFERLNSGRTRGKLVVKI